MTLLFTRKPATPKLHSNMSTHGYYSGLNISKSKTAIKSYINIHHHTILLLCCSCLTILQSKIAIKHNENQNFLSCTTHLIPSAPISNRRKSMQSSSNYHKKESYSEGLKISVSPKCTQRAKFTAGLFPFTFFLVSINCYTVETTLLTCHFESRVR